MSVYIRAQVSAASPVGGGSHAQGAIRAGAQKQTGADGAAGRAGGSLTGRGHQRTAEKERMRRCGASAPSCHVPGAVLSLRSMQGSHSWPWPSVASPGLRSSLEHLQLQPLSWPTHPKGPIKF